MEKQDKGKSSSDSHDIHMSLDLWPVKNKGKGAELSQRVNMAVGEVT